MALHGRDGEDGTVQELLEILGIPYTGSGVLACSRAMDKVMTKHLLLAEGIPTPEFFAFTQTAFRELGAADTLPAIEERLDFPIVVKPSRQGSALGIKFARSAQDVPGALMSGFSYDERVLLERYVRGRDLAVSVLDGPDGPQPLPVVEAVPQGEDFYDFAARYDIGRTTFVCPADAARRGDRARPRAGAGHLRAAGLLRVRARGPDAGRGRRAVGAGGQRDPGADRHQLLPQAAEAAGIGFDDLVARILASAFDREALSRN